MIEGKLLTASIDDVRVQMVHQLCLIEQQMLADVNQPPTPGLVAYPVFQGIVRRAIDKAIKQAIYEVVNDAQVRTAIRDILTAKDS